MKAGNTSPRSPGVHFAPARRLLAQKTVWGEGRSAGGKSRGQKHMHSLQTLWVMCLVPFCLRGPAGHCCNFVIFQKSPWLSALLLG